MGTIVRERIRKGLPPPRSCHRLPRSPILIVVLIGRPQPNVALPVPPHSAGLQPTRVPSTWLQTDGGKSTRLNGLDRTHSLQIFSSLTGRAPKKTRRSNLVMSLTSSIGDRLAHRRPYSRRRRQWLRLGSVVVLGVVLERGHGRWDRFTAVE